MVRCVFVGGAWLVLATAWGCEMAPSEFLQSEASLRYEAESIPLDSEQAMARQGVAPGLVPARLLLRDASVPPTGTPAETVVPTDDSGAPGRRLRIYSASFQLLVANVDDAVGRFLQRVDALGGYLETRKNASVTVRVPAARFQELSEELRDYGLVTDESMQAVDVTKQFYDLKIRIENAEVSRTRLLALLEKADQVEDALRIENELRRLTEEIDRLQGELKFLSERIAFSTIEVHFSSTAPPPRTIPQRTRSRFDWINEVGVEHAIAQF